MRDHSSTILLIDDSASVREVLRVTLESDGYSVLEAADGRERVRVSIGNKPRSDPKAIINSSGRRREGHHGAEAISFPARRRAYRVDGCRNTAEQSILHQQ